jgi:serine/threonine protein kinase/HD-GYP domain-containing protein (c-di-GMP phosphodiesterase class II)
MAEVFLARSVGPGGFVKSLVIKRILPHLGEDPAFVEMFLREAQIAAKLDHPNIVQVFDFGEADGTYYLAMEYIDGPNLRSILRRRPEGHLAESMAARIVAFACEGLGYAHEFCDPSSGTWLHLVHRDVSTDNIVLSRTGTVKVLDFGVAKSGGMGSTRNGLLKGKMAYMPPEQINGEVDSRTDIYALGVILYELTTGAKPYPQRLDVELLAAILRQPPVPLRSRRPDIHPAFVAIVEKAMARDPDDRYQSCRELQLALDDFLAGLGERVTPTQLAQLVAAYRSTTVSSSLPQPKSPSGSEERHSRPSRVLSVEDVGAVSVSQVRPAGAEVLHPFERAATPAQHTPAREEVIGRLSSAVAAFLGIGQADAEASSESSGPVYLGDVHTAPTAENLVPPEGANSSSTDDPFREALLTVDTRAESVLAHAESIRNSRMAGRLGSEAELATLRHSFEHDESSVFPLRFLRAAPRLMSVGLGAYRILTHAVRGAIHSLIYLGDAALLLDELERLRNDAKPQSPNARWVYDQARAALVHSSAVTHLNRLPFAPEARERLRVLAGAELKLESLPAHDAVEAEFLALVQAATVCDPGSAFFEAAFGEFASMLASLKTAWEPRSAALHQWLEEREVETIRLNGRPPVESIKETVRWLTDAHQAAVLPTPGVERICKGGVPQEVRWPPAPTEGDPALRSIRRYLDLFETFSTCRSSGEAGALALRKLRMLIRQLAELSRSKSVRFMGITSAEMGHTALALHAANVVMLVVAFAGRLELSIRQTEQLAWLAALHDIGVMQIPDATYQRAGRWLLDRAPVLATRPMSRVQRFYASEEAQDLEHWHQATYRSAQLALLHQPGPFGLRAATAAFEWMQSARGVTSELIATAKDWDLLTSRGPGGPAKSPEAAGLDLLAGRHAKTHPLLVSAFVRFAHKQSHHSLSRPAPAS